MKIKIAILPCDDCNVDSMLSDLAGKGLIVRYESEGQKVISIPKFLVHQNPHINEKPSTLPRMKNIKESPIPDKTLVITGAAPPMEQAVPPKDDPLRLNPESPFLNPES